MSNSKPKVRDARFKNRPEAPRPEPRAPRPKPTPSPKSAPGATPSPDSEPSSGGFAIPWNAVVPALLAIGVGVGVWTLWKDCHPTPPAPAVVADAGAGEAADAGAPSTAGADAGAARAGEGMSGDPVNPRVETPTTPDPRRGRYTLAQATEGIEGTGPLVAEIETSMGTFTCNLLSEEAPNTVANFIGLARGTREFWDPVEGAWARRPFYNGSIFHRVIPDFMIQGGDLLRSGRGGTGYEFDDENVNGHNAAGQLCMANRGPNTNGGQFFITEGPRTHLDGSYSIFGRCTPADLVGRIARVPRNSDDRPEQPVFIRNVRVRRAG